MEQTVNKNETAKPEPKVSAGDKAIAASTRAGGNVKDLRKALWSIRGDLKVSVAGTNAQVAVVKAAIVDDLNKMKDDAPAPFMLVSLGKGGYELKAVPAPKK